MMWRTILSLPDYEVSERGDVRRIKAARGGVVGKQLKPWVREDGYRMFIMRSGGRSLHKKAHQLVAEAFHGPKPFEGAEVCHNDGTRTNDHWSNLRWGTRAENHADKIKHGTSSRGENQGSSKLTTGDVIAIREAFAAGEIQRLIAARYGVGQAQVSRIVHGVRWGHLE